METRYAIIIGINDYDTEPLSFCVNDGSSLKEILISKASFRNQNVHPILSSTDTPIKDITGTLLSAITKISETFEPNEDSIFFYFAGHGVSVSGQSHLVFHDSNFPIKNIFEKINELKPKLQYYVIDACESGGKTLARNISCDANVSDFEEYISSSSGIMFLYACQNTEKAFEIESVQHGIMTYYFIEAINRLELYDEDGILTPGRIQEYVSKNVSKKSKFTQNPVVESRITGYYPFAAKGGKLGIEDAKIVVDSEFEDTSRAVIENVAYDRDSRLRLQSLTFERVQALNNEIIQEYEDEYEIYRYKTLNELPVKNTGILRSRIVSEATSKLQSIKSTIYFKKTPIYESRGGWQNSIAVMLGEKERVVKGYRDDPEINFESEYISSTIVIAKSKSIEKVSFGLGCVIYQSKWGMVVSPYCFMIDWDGEEDCLINDIKKENYSFLINADYFTKVNTLTFNIYNQLATYIEGWNKKRKDEIHEFEMNKM
jgi:hypothetical protein